MAEVPQPDKAECMRKETQSADAIATASAAQEIPARSPKKPSEDGSIVIEAEVSQPSKNKDMRDKSHSADKSHIDATITSQELLAQTSKELSVDESVAIEAGVPHPAIDKDTTKKFQSANTNQSASSTSQELQSESILSAVNVEETLTEF